VDISPQVDVTSVPNLRSIVLKVSHDVFANSNLNLSSDAEPDVNCKLKGCCEA